MKKINCLLTICLSVFFTTVYCQVVYVRYDNRSPQASYAAGIVRKALLEKKYKLSADGEYSIQLITNRSQGAEAYAIKRNDKQLTVTGGDDRGMLYGALSVAEDLRNGVPLQKITASNAKPHYGLRAIKFDLPWDTYRHSYALDQHQQTCSDTAYWKAFLDMMAANRFNALSLWNLHPYVYMIRAKNFPEATPFNETELNKWRKLFTSIFRMAKERCIDTYLIPFNIFVSPEFAQAHHVALDNLEHHFFVNGDTAEIIKRYTRESVTQVLKEYPDLTGFGLTLGEGMAGMTPQQREDWMKETIIEGMRLAGRKTKLVHRIPFSSTTGSLDVTSIETEKLTRKAIEEEGNMDFIEGPVWADLKYNWSHAHSTPKLVKVHGGKLYDTYFKPVPTTYKITWTARNEDFFCLRWGVPGFVRDHIAANSQPYTGGYFIGSETYIPAKDYFTAISGPVNWKYAFERQWLFYKIWGRLLYDPATPDAVFQNEFINRYGPAAAPLLEASALAGQTPLRLASSFDFTWDFSLYSEGFLALNTKTKTVEYISVNRQIDQPPLDTDYVSIKDFVASPGSFPKNKITPLTLAEMMESDCNKALQLISNISAKGNNTLMYEIADIKTWANLGLYFAAKTRGAVALQQYRINGGEENKKAAVGYLERSLGYWDTVISITRPIYKDMPLVHFTEQNGNRSKENDQLRFHWEKLRADVAKDIEIARTATKEH
ncbi:MAG: hypothetical protein JWQ30_2428 [Sediminibacterium sp.]|nr:hypothetical protein [Sediminibacterium sp.]